MKRILIILLLIIFIITGCAKQEQTSYYYRDREQEFKEYTQKLILYKDCLNQPYTIDEETEDIILYKNELNNYLTKYHTSIQYEDLTKGYTYNFNINKNYYAASTIKMLSALYLYEKAADGDIDIQQTIQYKAINQRAYSAGMQHHRVGEYLTLRQVIQYMLLYSDNTAYDMIINYIGKNNIRAYGNSLGATMTMVGGDNFGTINTKDSIIYLKTLYNYINENESLGSEIQQTMFASDQNDLKIIDKEIPAATKYGEYYQYYHNIGIVYDKNPYAIAVLTLDGVNENEIRDINNHIYTLHNMYYINREQSCKLQIFGEEKNIGLN